MTIDNENINDVKAFIEGMEEIILNMVSKPLKDMVRFCLETNNATGIKRLMSLLNQFNYDTVR